MQLWQRMAAAAVVLSSGFAMLAETPAVGAKAPDFTLSTPEGAKVSLGELSAKGPVVLVFLRGYPGYQCPYCQKQVHDFQANSDKFAKLKTQLLLVYPGPQAVLDDKAKEFITLVGKLPPNFHLVVDPNYTVTNQYSLRWDEPRETAYPSTFVLDRAGKIFFEKISKVHGDRTTATDLLPIMQKVSGE